MLSVVAWEPCQGAEALKPADTYPQLNDYVHSTLTKTSHLRPS